MKTFNVLYHLFLTVSICVVLLFAGIGCEKDAAVTNSTNEPSKVEGTVVDESNTTAIFGKSTTGVEGATVTLAQVQANGSLATVSSASVQTDVNGKFVVETSLHGVTNLVVVASKGVQTWKAVLSAQVRNGITVYASPLTVETTVEAEVYQRIVAQEDDRTVTTTDVGAYVNANVAASVQSNTTVIAQLATAIIAQTHASDSLLLTMSGSTFTKLQTLKQLQTQAQASFDAAVYLASNNQTVIATAREAYYQAIANAYTSAGLSLEAYAKARAVSSTVIAKYTSTFSSELQLEVAKEAALQKAIALEAAFQSNFVSVGATQFTLNALVSANASLETSINTAASLNEITNAFLVFHDSVVTQLRFCLTMYSSAVVTVDNSVNSPGGAKATLETSVNTNASAGAMVTAYSNFFTSVRTAVQTTLNNASSIHVQATAEILILSNLTV
jgi:hypothetical protein